MLAQLVLFDGFDLLDAVAPYEVLWAGGAMAGGALTVEFVSAEGARSVPSGPSGVALAAVGPIRPREASLLVVPGAAGSLREEDPGSIPMLLAQAAQTTLPRAVRVALETPGTTVATVCGGSLLLAMAGLLEGRRAVTHHEGMEVLRATGATTISARVVDDGNLVSAGGVTSGLDLGMYLLERLLGPQIACGVEALFAYERRGTVWRAAGPAPVRF